MRRALQVVLLAVLVRALSGDLAVGERGGGRVLRSRGGFRPSHEVSRDVDPRMDSALPGPLRRVRIVAWRFVQKPRRRADLADLQGVFVT